MTGDRATDRLLVALVVALWLLAVAMGWAIKWLMDNTILFVHP